MRNVVNTPNDGTITAEVFNAEKGEPENAFFNDQLPICSFNARSLRCFSRSTGASTFFSETYSILAIQEVQADYPALKKSSELWP